MLQQYEVTEFLRSEITSKTTVYNELKGSVDVVRMFIPRAASLPCHARPSRVVLVSVLILIPYCRSRAQRQSAWDQERATLLDQLNRKETIVREELQGKEAQLQACLCPSPSCAVRLSGHFSEYLRRVA